MPSDNSRASSIPMPKDLLEINEYVFNQCSFNCTLPVAEAESADYGAHTFAINGRTTKYRVAKITPTKTGLFVTLWKRIGKGPIQPFDVSDDIDLFMISTRNDEHFGLFIFPKSVLQEKKIISDHQKEGKRAMRVYPPWAITTSRQAQKTQQWQLAYFLEISQDKAVDIVRAKRLLGA